MSQKPNLFMYPRDGVSFIIHPLSPEISVGAHFVDYLESNGYLKRRLIPCNNTINDATEQNCPVCHFLNYIKSMDPKTPVFQIPLPNMPLEVTAEDLLGKSSNWDKSWTLKTDFHRVYVVVDPLDGQVKILKMDKGKKKTAVADEFLELVNIMKAEYGREGDPWVTPFKFTFVPEGDHFKTIYEVIDATPYQQAFQQIPFDVKVFSSFGRNRREEFNKMLGLFLNKNLNLSFQPLLEKQRQAFNKYSSGNAYTQPQQQTIQQPQQPVLPSYQPPQEGKFNKGGLNTPPTTVPGAHTPPIQQPGGFDKNKSCACGKNPIYPSWNFCPKCGTSLKTAPTSSSVIPTPQQGVSASVTQTPILPKQTQNTIPPSSQTGTPNTNVTSSVLPQTPPPAPPIPQTTEINSNFNKCGQCGEVYLNKENHKCFQKQEQQATPMATMTHTSVMTEEDIPF